MPRYALRLVFSLGFAVFNPSSLLAQAPQIQVADFIGVVQHATGTPQKVSGLSKTEDLRFKSFIHEGDQLHLDSDERLKIITAQRCVGVLYDSSEMKVTTRDGQPLWQLVDGSLRWICPSGQSENLMLGDQAVTVSSGEILFHDNLLQVRKSRVLSKSGELQTGQTYKWNGNTWIVKYPTTRAYKNWKLNQELAMPKESLAAGPEPQRYVSSRWSLSPMLGRGGMSHPVGGLGLEEFELHGFKAMANFLWGNHSVIGGIGWFEAEDPTSNEFGPGTMPNYPGQFSRVESLFTEAGLRFNHLRSWSFFTKVGLHKITHHIDAQFTSFGLHRSVDFLGTSVSVGVDKVFETFWDWGAVYTSIEFMYARTLTKLGSKRGQEFVPTPTPPEVENSEDNFGFGGFLITIGPALVW